VPIYPPPPNLLMYRRRCDILHRATAQEDQPGSVNYGPGAHVPREEMVLCDQEVMRDDPLAATLRSQGRQAVLLFSFPDDHDMEPGDIILERGDDAELTGRGCVVELYRRVGRLHMRKYHAICSAWQRRRF
jgi:hypothetical protein